MITSWSPSRLATYQQCPQLAKWQLIDKLCPLCFRGKLEGFENPICNNCKQTPLLPPPLKRGNEVHKAAENWIMCRTDILAEDFNHPIIKPLMKELREAYKNKHVLVEQDIVLDYQYRPISKFNKEAWARLKLDVIHIVSGSLYRVIDWKTGNVDKNGKIKPDEKYEQQLQAYSMAVLSAFPTVETVQSMLVFVDADDSVDPIVYSSEGDARRKDMRSLKLKWKKRVARMFADKTFVASPNDKCQWCPFRKSAGGPCAY